MIGALPITMAVRKRLLEKWDAAAARTTDTARGYGAPIDVRIRRPEAVRLSLTEDEQHWPVVYVIPGSARSDEQTGTRVSREQEVVVILEDDRDSTEHLTTALLLGEATIIDALTGPAQPEPPIYGLIWKATEPGPLFQRVRDSTAWHSYLEISFQATIVEEESR